ncbi:hypothetical protein [Amycolatopsis saalfeldensis]|uniref:Uncharacterized protein n=1 Tax=Amycolatopsis saalfeldensis TaxID=394193 RepID=A0A1H8YSP1_9PSEU|nr:hypothetical protein [Amycolatopsis saalfeldensis]SEP54408.1 hypothetical protein SAMN04489732_1465 [Amycolatopsis saalfeldensis]
MRVRERVPAVAAGAAAPLDLAAVTGTTDGCGAGKGFANVAAAEGC